MDNLFTCNNCSQEKPIVELASTVPVFMDEPIKTCRECYNQYHNPPKEKVEKKEFKCDYCGLRVLSVLYHRRVDVSMPNEVGMIKGQAYKLCSRCNKKVKEYNEAEDSDDEEKGPWS